MIKNIEKLKEQSSRYIKEFIECCTIEEKIDAHYITVEIISKSDIKIKKANGAEIDRIDLILNSMWNKLFIDWNYLKISNAKWFASHVGYTIKMFYFPCETPILTTYKEGLRYVFDKLTFNGNDLDCKTMLSDIKFPKVYSVGYKHSLNKVKDLSSIISKTNEDIKEAFSNLIDKDNSELFATSEPEGYIFKYNKKIFQMVKEKEIRKIDSDKSIYEFLLADFIKYCKLNNYTDKILPSYTSTICNLFNDYIVNCEKKTHYIENNIDTESIEPPYLGHRFDIGYEYVPDQITKALCQESELYKNIFKVLLASLRKGKDLSHCSYLSKKEVDDWNNIMKSIKIRNIYI